MFKISTAIRHQALTIFPVFIGNTLFGCGIGWVAPSLAYFKSKEHPYPVTDNELTWIASSFFFTRILASIGAMFIGNKVGRKSFLIASNCGQIISWYLMSISSTNFVIGGRILLGLSAGINDAVWSIYVGEIASPDKRGLFSFLLLSGYMAGITLEYLLGSLLAFKTMVLFPLATALINGFLVLFVKETPHFFLMKGKDDLARKSFAWLSNQNNQETFIKEFEEIKGYINEQIKESSFNVKDIFKYPSSEYKLCAISILIFFMMNPTGNIIFLSYQTLILDSFENLPDGRKLTLIYGILQYIAVTISSFLIDGIRRRVLLIFGFIICAVIQITNTYLIYMAEKYKYFVSYYIPLFIVLLNIYGIIFISCLLPIAFLLKSELFPQKLKPMGNTLDTISNSLAEFLVLKPFLFIWHEYGLYVNFVVCSIICIIGLIYSYILVPETKGKTLVEIQKDYDNKTNSTVMKIFTLSKTV